jgi:DNA-directed RNA polymerase subunit RPC12/RpoP
MNMTTQTREEKRDDLVRCKCYYCNEIFESPIESEGEEISCPNCKESIIVQTAAQITQARPLFPQKTQATLTKLPDWLRWILVLPASIGAYWAIQFLIILLSLLSPSEGFIEPRSTYIQFINSIAGPVCFILTGAKIAPKYQFIVALCLTVLHTAIIAGLVSVAVFADIYNGSKFWLVLTSVVGILATVICTAFLYKQNESSLIQTGR